MTPNEYQQKANRTICDQGKALGRMCFRYNPQQERFEPDDLVNVQINHGLVGLAGEVGELCTAWQRVIYYGKGALDLTNLIEELGDILWYVAEICSAAGIDLNDVMEANIRKLQVRYPDKYTDHHAAEENRDRKLEEEVIYKTVEEQRTMTAKEAVTAQTQCIGKETAGVCPVCQTKFSDRQPQECPYCGFNLVSGKMGPL